MNMSCLMRKKFEMQIMFREPKAMREIHKIQEKLYEERKGLTAEQEIRLIRDNAQKMKEKHGIKSKTHAITGPHGGK